MSGMKSYSGGYGVTSGTGAKSISSASYSNAPKQTTGISSNAYGQAKVISQSKPTSISGGAPAKKNDEMTAYQRLLADRDAQKQAASSGLSLSGSASKKQMYGQLERNAQTREDEEARQRAEMQRK